MGLASSFSQTLKAGALHLLQEADRTLHDNEFSELNLRRTYEFGVDPSNVFSDYCVEHIGFLFRSFSRVGVSLGGHRPHEAANRPALESWIESVQVVSECLGSPSESVVVR